jgi:hypothetical protein
VVEDRDALGIAVAVDHMELWMVQVHMQDLVVLADPQAAPMEAPGVDVTLGDEDDTGMAAVVDGHMAALAEVLPVDVDNNSILHLVHPMGQDIHHHLVEVVRKDLEDVTESFVMIQKASCDVLQEAEVQ